MEEAPATPDEARVAECLSEVGEPTRARARGIAVRRFQQHLVQANWRSLVFDLGNGPIEVELRPEVDYGPELENTEDVGSFIEAIRGIV
jgi:hypothetical protein